MNIKPFHTKLHRWYQAYGRKELPWRNTGDAYAIYISEIMLQQTQVSTVLERYYFPFLKKFPTIYTLAKAKETDVLKAWQGLGYYNRAINLHHAAKQCDGTLPQTVEELIQLKGVGRNTAHAVAAFAYHQPVAVMEANVKRVVSRIFALKNPSEHELWERAEKLLDHKNPFDYNQAMMDIGALICKRRAPLCHECPATDICKGKDNPEAYPAPKTKKTTPVRRKTIVVSQNGQGKFHATPRTTRFLNGMYHFKESSTPPRNATKLGYVRQQYSHFTLEADVYMKNSTAKGKDWYSLAQLKKLPMSMAEQKILKMLQTK